MGPQCRAEKRPVGVSGAEDAAPNAQRNQSSARPGLAVRRAAQRLLAAVIETRTSLDGLTDDEHGHPQFMALDLRDRSLARAILASALRHRMTIDHLLSALFDRPLPKNATNLLHILHVAAAQILFLDVPDHSAVDLAVESAKSDPRSARFASLVNAVLRKLIRSKEAALPEMLAKTDDAPDWFVERLRDAYGAEKARAILTIHRLPAPLDLTVKEDAAGWAARLNGMVLPNGTVRLESFAGKVSDLPGFAEGAWWVQDVAASLPARLLGDINGKRVADLCAAPGGKTSSLILQGAAVTAVDMSASRLKRLQGNLARLGLEAETCIANLLDFKPAELFDAVLLDAPCSSTGTIRRHPDVAWTKTAEDIEKLAALQLTLLRHCMSMVKPGGAVLFSNCSLDRLEGEDLTARIFAEEKSVESFAFLPEELPGFSHLIDKDGCLRTTPADLDLGRPEISGMDGFYAARFKRLN
jgi:16S rRNA (cytosine967-C5)-methyltransferase